MTNATTEPTAAGTTVPGFGAAEIAYLLSNCTGAVKKKNIEVMQVRPEVLTEQIIAMGASSLLARDQLAVADGGQMEIRGAARLLNRTLATATRWTEIALVDETGVDASLYVQSPELSVFLQPAALSTWFMVAKAREASDAAMLKQIIENHMATHPAAVVYLGAQSLSGEKTHLFVRVDENKTWDIATVEGTGAQARTEGASTDDLLARLRALALQPEVPSA